MLMEVIGGDGTDKKAQQTTLNKHIYPAFEDRQIRAIRAADLQRFMNDHADMSRSSVGYLFSILRGVFRQAYAERIISVDPTVALTKSHAPEKPRRALTEAEINATLRVIGSHPEGLLLAILYYTGVRMGEALGLQ